MDASARGAVGGDEKHPPRSAPSSRGTDTDTGRMLGRMHTLYEKLQKLMKIVQKKGDDAHTKLGTLDRLQKRMKRVSGRPLYAKLPEDQKDLARDDGYEIYKTYQSLGLDGTTGKICSKKGTEQKDKDLYAAWYDKAARGDEYGRYDVPLLKYRHLRANFCRWLEQEVDRVPGPLMIRVEAEDKNLERKGATVPLRVLRNCVAHTAAKIGTIYVTLENETKSKLVAAGGECAAGVLKYEASMKKDQCHQWLARMHKRVRELVFGNAPVSDEVFVLDKSRLNKLYNAQLKSEAWELKEKQLEEQFDGKELGRRKVKARNELKQLLQAKLKKERTNEKAQEMLNKVRQEMAEALTGVGYPNVPWTEKNGAVGGYSNGVTSASFSRDGKRVVSGSGDNTVRIWDAETGQQQQELKGHRSFVTSVSFSRDGKRVVSGSGDKTVRIWDAETGQQQQELKGHRSFVTSASFSQDGKRVVSGSYDETVRIWDAETGQQQQELNGHSDHVTSVSFSRVVEALAAPCAWISSVCGRFAGW